MKTRQSHDGGFHKSEFSKTQYTHQDGVRAVEFLIKSGFPGAKLIGSLSKESATSTNDIDILIDNETYCQKLEEHLKMLLQSNKVVRTDWDGIYLYDTIFGNVDIFFTTEDFDY